MLNFSIKKYSALLAIVGSLLAGNVWAGTDCDIDRKWDISHWPQRMLKIKYDSGSGYCARIEWRWILFFI